MFLYLNRLDNFWNVFIGTAPFTKFYLFLKNLKKLKTKIVPKIVSKFVLKDRFWLVESQFAMTFRHFMKSKSLWLFFELTSGSVPRQFGFWNSVRDHEIRFSKKQTWPSDFFLLLDNAINIQKNFPSIWCSHSYFAID